MISKVPHKSGIESSTPEEEVTALAIPSPPSQYLTIPDLLLVTNYEDSHTYRSSNHTGFGLPSSAPQLDASFQAVASRPVPPPADLPIYTDPRAVYPAHSLPPQTSGYVETPVYASHPSRLPAQVYAAQGGYYAGQQYAHEPPPQHHRHSPQYSGPQYGNGPYGPPTTRDSREDLRHQPEYQDQPARYNYSPVATAANGGAASSPSHPARLASFCRLHQLSSTNI